MKLGEGPYDIRPAQGTAIIAGTEVIITDRAGIEWTVVIDTIDEAGCMTFTFPGYGAYRGVAYDQGGWIQ